MCVTGGLSSLLFIVQRSRTSDQHYLFHFHFLFQSCAPLVHWLHCCCCVPSWKRILSILGRTAAADQGLFVHQQQQQSQTAVCSLVVVSVWFAGAVLHLSCSSSSSCTTITITTLTYFACSSSSSFVYSTIFISYARSAAASLPALIHRRPNISHRLAFRFSNSKLNAHSAHSRSRQAGWLSICKAKTVSSSAKLNKFFFFFLCFAQRLLMLMLVQQINKLLLIFL